MQTKITLLLGKIIPWPLYFFGCRRFPAALLAANKNMNESLPRPAFPIHDQQTSPIRPFRYGNYSVSYNGCAPIALFNGLYIKNCGQPLSLLIHALEESGCLCMGGRFGTNPYRLSRLLKKFPVSFTRYFRLSSLEKDLLCGDAAILAIWNDRCDLKKGAHFFTVCKTPDGYLVYNRQAAISDFSSLTAVVGQGTLLAGYRIF